METEILRPLADYPANIWENLLISFSKSDLESEVFKANHTTLKEVVKEMFVASTVNPMDNIEFIDVLCRLGVSYHFEIDIMEQLRNLFNNLEFNRLIRHDSCDLYTVGLVFQVFRQFGFKLLTDVFEKFKDENGKLKEHLVEDARGMLSFYEASQWSIHGEAIIDEALDFSSMYLREISSRCSPNLAIRIKNAIKHSYHKGISRIETRQYISYYEGEETCDANLLEFAKMDFNMLQMLYQDELTCISRWYNEIEFESKVRYTRHRIAEAYLWALGTYFEPKYFQARVILGKAIILYTALDDVYDAYGTMEELELFTHAIEKWLPVPPNEIPESMKYVYSMLIDFYDKCEEKLENEGKLGCGFHLKKSLKSTTNAYLQEAKWLKEDYNASVDEYKENAILSSGYYTLIAMAFVGMGDEAKLDAFEWLSSNPKIRIASELICRFTNDIVDHEFEQQREHVATGIKSYMNQYGVSKEEAVKIIQNIVSDAWKDINEELMSSHQSCPLPLFMRVLNLSRVIDVFYRYQNAYNNPEFLKQYIVSTLIKTIPT